MTDKITSWWSSDSKWFCILVDDGVNKATVSLNASEVEALRDSILSLPPPKDEVLTDLRNRRDAAARRGDVEEALSLNTQVLARKAQHSTRESQS